ncbi:putative 1-phosphatidylinositol 4 [Triplophysa rosa]|uniref:1-phosphatidylinositol 4 n=1 Tax=Triplophysa rosa TaxID=992332 RepID=A0A9W7TX19_TRIRA|nr:putative 1-phosphatidylinositol 4 [Triplophysa rosa]
MKEGQDKDKSDEGSPQEQSLKRRQAATLGKIRDLISQLNKDAVSEHSKNMWSLPNELTEAVNSCVKPHYPDHMEKAVENRTEPANGQCQVFVG